jgi:hypothetical protein
VITVPGLVYDLDEQEYHRDPVPGGSLSSTTAKRLLPPSCPALARWKTDHPEQKDAYNIGSVAHSLVLGAGCEIVEVAADSWRTTSAKAERAEARSRGAVALLTDDFEAAHAMADAVRQHPIAGVLFTDGRAEVSAFWRERVPFTEAQVWCRARFDYLREGMIVDLKTTSGGTDDASIGRSIAKFGYHVQEAFYRRSFFRLTGDGCGGAWPAFVFVFVDVAPPHLVRVVELDDPTREQGARDVDTALQIWHDCRESGVWPGRDTGVGMVGLPRWALDRVDA